MVGIIVSCTSARGLIFRIYRELKNERVKQKKTIQKMNLNLNTGLKRKKKV